MFNLDDYDPEGLYSVFDDFEWKFLAGKKQWFGGQRQFTVTDKYRHKRTILNDGRPSVFIFNKDNDPRKEMTSDESDYFHSNCLFVWCHTPLFVSQGT